MSIFEKEFYSRWFFFLAIISPGMIGSVTAEVRLIEEEAIPFMAFLKKSDFDDRFPGQLYSDINQLSAGWYVIYEHEALSYYFGPILLEATGEDYLAELDQIVNEAVAQRPSIADYTLQLSYEPKHEFQTVDPSAPKPSIPSNRPSSPPQETGLFNFFKRLFGFR